MNTLIKPKPAVDRHVQPSEKCCGSAHERQHAPAIDDCCTACPPKSEQGTPPRDAIKLRYRIDKMDCPTEEGLIRTRLKSLAGIARLDFNLLDRELTVYHRLDDPLPITLA